MNETVITNINPPSSPEKQKISVNTSLSTKPLQEPRVAVIRHCAYCLQVCDYPAKKCGGCKKRAYCSQVCQKKDWSTGQCHKNWCSLHQECGEEDVDWEVKPVPNKGLGIIAKKFIPAGFKIIVEPGYSSPSDHPGIKDLEPNGGSLSAKFNLNSVWGPDGVEMVVGLRTSRLNHNCRPNVGTNYDETARVLILFAQRDIHPGEEMCINCSHFGFLESGCHTNNMSAKDALEFEQSKLYKKFGFICPEDCYCKDPGARDLVMKGTKFYLKMQAEADKGLIEKAFMSGEVVIESYQKLGVCWYTEARVHYKLFDVGVTKSKTLYRALKHLESCLKIRRIIAPFSVENTLSLEELLKNPRKHPGYLSFDKKEAIEKQFPDLRSLVSLKKKDKVETKPSMAYKLKEELETKLSMASQLKEILDTKLSMASELEEEIETKPSKSKDEVETSKRHCAFCLKVCSSISAKLCGGCLKRAYCSKDCQLKDWSAKGSGQRHKLWCGRHDYGEEDVDWEVVPVPNKGLGIVAKRFLPAGFRIIVEPVFTNPHDHPGINDLEPKGSTLERKFQLNSFGGHPERDGGKTMLGLRSSRINHSCRPNAGMAYDEAARVKIIHAERDIQLGEEISIIYTHFGNLESNSPSPSGPLDDLQKMFDSLIRIKRGIAVDPSGSDDEFDAIQRTMRLSWGFICPADCYCKDPDVRKLILEGKEAFKKLVLSGSKGRLDEAMKAGERVLEIHGQLNLSRTGKASVHNFMFELAVCSSRTEERAKKHLEESLKVVRITAPYSEKTMAQEELLKNLEEYLKCMSKKSKMSSMISSFSSVLSNE